MKLSIPNIFSIPSGGTGLSYYADPNPLPLFKNSSGRFQFRSCSLNVSEAIIVMIFANVQSGNNFEVNHGVYLSGNSISISSAGKIFTLPRDVYLQIDGSERRHHPRKIPRT